MIHIDYIMTEIEYINNTKYYKVDTTFGVVYLDEQEYNINKYEKFGKRRN